MKRRELYLICAFICVFCGNKIDMNVNGGPSRIASVGEPASGCTECNITADPTPADISVLLNGASMSMIEHSQQEFTFCDSNIPMPGGEYRIDIETEYGSAAATCTLPGAFDISEPAADSVIVDTSITISWTAAQYVNWYMIKVTFLYFDTTNTFIAKDTVLETTDISITIAGDWFAGFQGQGDILLEVHAGNGPSIVSKTESSVSGADGGWVGLNGQRKNVDVIAQ